MKHRSLVERSAGGSDRNLQTHGADPHYWYSIGDGIRLLMQIRAEYLFGSRQGAEGHTMYEAIKENSKRILLTDPYHIDNFAKSLQDEINKISTGLIEGKARDSVKWQYMPTKIIIPLLAGAHWRVIKIDLDYQKGKLQILFDDPYGKGGFKQYKQLLTKLIIDNVQKLISTETEQETANIFPAKFMEKVVNQQGRDNSWDCGPIIFSNIRDYITYPDQTIPPYTILEYKAQGHYEQITQIRQQDIDYHMQVAGVEINQQRAEEIQYNIGLNESQIKELKTAVLSDNHLSKKPEDTEEDIKTAQQEEVSIPDRGSKSDLNIIKSTTLRSPANKSQPQSLQLIDKLIKDLEKTLGYHATAYDDDLIAGEDEDVLELLQINGDHTAPCNPEEERAKTLEKITIAYGKGKSLWDLDQEAAALEFVKALKPVLSKPAMQNLYVNIDDCKEILLDSMYHLGKLYLAADKYTERHAKAATIFQYCAKFAAKYKVGDHADLLRQAYDVEQLFLASIGKKVTHKDNSTSIQEVKEYKNELEQIRAVVKQRLDAIKDLTITQIEQRAKEVELIYRDCTSFFVNNNQDKTANPGLVQKLLTSCCQQLGQPPKDCQYSIIGLGSLASGRMTPWSDLEFAVLINEDKEEYKEYFRNLTKLLHIKVINLGETPLRSAGVELLNNFRTTNKSNDWFWDELSTNGFSFDGPDWHACKFPLGRQGQYQTTTTIKLENGAEQEILAVKPDYELILTPKELARFQTEQPQDYNKESWFKSDPHLVEALRLVSLIDGRQDLLDAYRQEMKEAVDVAIVRARALGELQQDVSKFSLKLGDKEEGKLLDVKKDIFRIGDRVINDLADYYGIMAEKGQPGLTAWQIIDKMEHRKILSSEGAKHLKEAISIATELRLSTYSHNQGQKEGMSTYQPAVSHLSEKQKKALLEETFYIKDTSILHHFYYVMLIVQELAQRFCSQENHNYAEFILKHDNLFFDSNEIKGLIHARFLEYDKAIMYMQKASEQKPSNFVIQDNLFYLYNKTGAIEQAMQVISHIVKNYDRCNLLDIADDYTNFASAKCTKGDYDGAVEYYSKSLDIYKELYKKADNLKVATGYSNLGLAYYCKGNYDQAIRFHKLALKIRHEVHKHNLNHLDIADSYNNFGTIYCAKGDYEKATECYKLALKIRYKVHEHNPNHPDIADSYNNLSNICHLNGDYKNSTTYCYQSLQILLKAYEHTNNHPHIAAIYNNLATSYCHNGNYEEALKYDELAQAIYLKAYEYSPNHPNIASCYNNFGVIFKHIGHYEKAIEYYDRALKIYIKAHKDNINHPDIADSYSNLGSIYFTKREYSSAKSNYDKSLKIRLQIYKNNLNHPDIADSYSNLGSIAQHKAIYKDALQYYQQALDIYLIAYSNQNHPRVADIYDSFGSIYSDKGLYTSAMSHYKQALDIRIQLYKHNLNHPDIAGSYNNLGNICGLQGDYKQAISYYNKALSIYCKIYQANQNHPDIANSYDNLGNIYALQGDYKQSISYCNKALEIYIIAYKNNLNHLDIAKTYSHFGNLHSLQGNYEKSISYYNDALRIQSYIYEGNIEHPDIATNYNNLGAAYELQGDYNKADENYARALSIRMQVYKHNLNHPDIAASYGNLATICRIKENYEQSISYHNKALKIYDEIYKNNPNHPDMFKIYNSFGNVYYAKKDYITAAHYYEKAMSIYPEAYKHNLDHPHAATGYNNLGNISYLKGAYENAVTCYNNALRIQLKVYKNNPEHPEIIRSYKNLGIVYSAMAEHARDTKDYEKAISYYKLFLNTEVKIHQNNLNDPVISKSYNDLGDVYCLKGDYDSTIQCYMNALNILLKIYEKQNPDVASSYNNLSFVHYLKGEYHKALSYSKEACLIFESFATTHKQNLAITFANWKNILVQLGNEALLKGAKDEAKKYYAQIDPKYKHIDLNSPEFIELQLEWQNIAYKSQALDAAINSQLVLLKIDPKLHHGNHYHNLACFYSVKGDIKQANEVFIKALSHKVSSALHVEYAQFLLLNANYLNPSPQAISNHLYAAIANDDSSLEYGLLEKDTISNILKNIIEENRQSVSITPRVLAYYLLVKHPQYLADNDNVGNALQILREIYENSQNHISLKLLADAYESIGYKVLVVEQNAVPADSPPEPPQVASFSQQDEVPISGAADSQ